jgi:hypothetical protein
VAQEYLIVMKLERIKQYIQILVFIHSKGTVHIPEVCEHFSSAYTTINDQFTKWTAEGFLKREEIQKVKLSDPTYRFSLTVKGVQYLEDLRLLLETE